MIGEILGSYRLVEPIGKGGMGVVYRAEHVVLGRTAAVKLLLPESSRDTDLVQRFFNEARAAAKIQHRGLVEVLDYGHHVDGSAFIVMELLAGESLAARIERERMLAITTALAITRQVASALYAAHEQAIIHRDLKPENIFLVPDAEAPAGVRVKVLDFGIAKLAGTDEKRSVKTKTGAVFGTPRYMSPEQCKNATNVDARSDIYALGCILHEMVIGHAPFDYDTWGELIAAHIYVTPKPPRQLNPNVPAAVEGIIMRALAKEPADRFASMHELAQGCEALWKESLGTGRGALFTPVSGIAVEKPPTTAPPTASAPTLPVAAQMTAPPVERSRRRAWIPIAAVALAGIAAAAVFAMRDRDESTAPVQAPPRVVEQPDAAPLAPAIDAAPAAPQHVELVIESSPGGADVYRAIDGVKLGKTPFKKQYERVEGEAVFLINLAGYEQERVTLSTAHDGNAVAKLRRERRPHRPSPQHRKPQGSGGPTVLDPYGEGQ